MQIELLLGPRGWALFGSQPTNEKGCCGLDCLAAFDGHAAGWLMEWNER